MVKVTGLLSVLGFVPALEHIPDPCEPGMKLEIGQQHNSITTMRKIQLSFLLRLHQCCI